MAKKQNTELKLVQTKKTVCTGCFYFKKKDFRICPKDENGRLKCEGFKIWK